MVVTGSEGILSRPGKKREVEVTMSEKNGPSSAEISPKGVDVGLGDVV